MTAEVTAEVTTEVTTEVAPEVMPNRCTECLCDLPSGNRCAKCAAKWVFVPCCGFQLGAGNPHPAANRSDIQYHGKGYRG